MKNNHDELKKWVDQWKTTGPLLEEIRRNEIRESNTAQGILNLSDAFESCIRINPLQKSSGLVEMQLLLRKTKS